ncbi:MFS general substrate transporter [Meira miltonrushii]|uniref:MFS general substrate transporter n=1 Tax=Meira miltonrushii TaxID=1280837 RepID=A0A316VGS2_9BASI|nr:MFS general substrate transporter [Meira miltonrushii]PWN36736.1 MFS general substrate transporter [Meira miltonrushii]
MTSGRGNDTSAIAQEKVPTLILLTAGLLGLQCVWSTEMAFAGPFLLHLGISKSHMSIVFVAGPLSGLIVQPLIGVISDASTSRWGKRRPLLLFSLLTCAKSIFTLGFARPFASIISDNINTQSNITLILAIISIFTIDFSVNAVSALDRALLLDLVPMHLQATANAWCARLAGIGAIIGFLIGQADLTIHAPFKWFPALVKVQDGESDKIEAQMRCVCLLVVFLFLTTHAITLYVAKEKPANISGQDHSLSRTAHSRLSIRHHWQAVSKIISDLYSTAITLPRPILDLFRIQLFYSSAWFPILFYSTTWVAQIASQSPDYDDASAARLGSLAMLMHAVLSFACTLILPPLLERHNSKQKHAKQQYNPLSMLWSISTVVLAITLLCTWIVSATGSIHGAVLLIALTGFPWALAAWAPYSLLGILIRKEAESSRGSDNVPMTSRSILLRRGSHEQEAQFLISNGDRSDDDEESEDERLQYRTARHEANEDDQSSPEPDREHIALPMEAPPCETSDPEKGATILGLYNISVVMSQFFMTLVGTILFAVLEPDVSAKSVTPSGTLKNDVNSPDQHDAVGVILRVGGMFSIVAAFLIFRVARKHAAVLAD